ncbi:hypothetical protein [Agromyces aerolatus]|uniref:hypothetical protein n=1 Tax=Agromyces sp. LY-1074 TaxID=3074080 RepID=UPI0028565D8F|nr:MULTISPECIES: hypothetical protein [unclassified Agromyces]MDR5698814.1 hypothetical protein [Agromyces sp. LY-1074]MDR5705408.1 hypothetical protein [Agromyces sp. LY-1358]
MALHETSDAASEQPSESADEVGAQGLISHDFRVTNLTGRTMSFSGARPAFNNFETRFDAIPAPPIGTRFDPATESSFSLTYWVAYDNGVQMTYVIEGVGFVTLKATVDGLNRVDYSCSSVSAGLRCDMAGRNAIISSATPNERVVEAAAPQAQADALQKLCNDGSPYLSCAFQPKGQLVQALSEAELVGTYQHWNCKATTNDRVTLAWGIEETTTNSLGIAVTAEFKPFDKLTIAVQASYQHSWSVAHSYQEQHTLEVAPGYWGWFKRYTARVVATGDFVAKIGNDTVIIQDVKFDGPNPKGIGLLVSDERKLTPEERAWACTGQVPTSVAGITPPAMDPATAKSIPFPLQPVPAP